MGLAENTGRSWEVAEAMLGSFNDCISPIQQAITRYQPCTRAEAILVLEDVVHLIVLGQMLLDSDEPHEPDVQYVRHRLEGYIKDGSSFLFKYWKKIHKPGSSSLPDMVSMLGGKLRKVEGWGDENE